MITFYHYYWLVAISIVKIFVFFVVWSKKVRFRFIRDLLASGHFYKSKKTFVLTQRDVFSRVLSTCSYLRYCTSLASYGPLIHLTHKIPNIHFSAFRDLLGPESGQIFDLNTFEDLESIVYLQLTGTEIKQKYLNKEVQ